jgi:hypothetical protein
MCIVVISNVISIPMCIVVVIVIMIKSPEIVINTTLLGGVIWEIPTLGCGEWT